MVCFSCKVDFTIVCLNTIGISFCLQRFLSHHYYAALFKDKWRCVNREKLDLKQGYDKLMYNPNDYEQNYPFCRLKLLVVNVGNP